ncbi:MAG TPA: endolytic transglycosylase MltG [Chloroflexia bacterium]|nr:endolytic transglycosylase MltG [Chloroflexia bacterium]
MSFLGNIVKGILALAMVVAVIVAGVFIFTRATSIFGNDEKRHDPVVFVVKPGESITTIGENLKTAGVLEKSGLIDPIDQFKLELKRLGLEQKIQAGRFALVTHMDISDLVKKLSEPSTTVGLTFQIKEDKRLEEIAEQLSAQGIISSNVFLDLTKNPEKAAGFVDEFLAASGRPGDQGLEGYLFPDTYEIEYNEGDNSEVVIKTMRDNLEKKFTPEMRQAVADQGKTIHQVLTIASIVQREGQVAEELPVIASVFWNRLSQDMRLDADPTTQYALGKAGAWWPQLNLQALGVDSLTALEHSYNTYFIHGMPPGPICNPGEAAIRAAIYPQPDSNYLYFVAKNDGTGQHAFAETLEEHERNRVEYGNIQP